ncbi:MAG: RAMP superfamily CRISPR-associated protein, partial [Lentisphaeria bacterium]
MYLFAKSPVHVGAGNSVGVVDSPIMRERHTKTPIIPGSSLKGVISDLWNDEDY